MDKRKKRMIGVIIGLISTLFVVFTIYTDYKGWDVVSTITDFIWFGTLIATYVFSGIKCLWTCLKDVGRLSVKFGVAGWLVAPFPIDILSGLFTTVVAFCFGFMILFAILFMLPFVPALTALKEEQY
ncbi:MAG: hypothetical protein PUC12_10630 [Clostridiales bacterium]|nr:hypothetical protein [Clostridiales bacterium]